MNEETLIEKLPAKDETKENADEGTPWKQVTLGGVAGILMGAGLLYAGKVAAKVLSSEDKYPKLLQV